MKRKYTIFERLKQKPGVYRSNLYQLAIKLDKHVTTIENWMRIPAESHSSIPSDELYQIADFLNVNINDLINR